MGRWKKSDVSRKKKEGIKMDITTYEIIGILFMTLMFGHLIWTIQKRLEGKTIQQELEGTNVVYINAKSTNLIDQIDQIQREMLDQ